MKLFCELFLSVLFRRLLVMQPSEWLILSWHHILMRCSRSPPLCTQTTCCFLLSAPSFPLATVKTLPPCPSPPLPAATVPAFHPNATFCFRLYKFLLFNGLAFHRVTFEVSHQRRCRARPDPSHPRLRFCQDSLPQSDSEPTGSQFSGLKCDTGDHIHARPNTRYWCTNRTL